MLVGAAVNVTGIFKSPLWVISKQSMHEHVYVEPYGPCTTTLQHSTFFLGTHAHSCWTHMHTTWYEALNTNTPLAALSLNPCLNGLASQRSHVLVSLPDDLAFWDPFRSHQAGQTIPGIFAPQGALASLDDPPSDGSI